jgi:hypothetical protein
VVRSSLPCPAAGLAYPPRPVTVPILKVPSDLHPHHRRLPSRLGYNLSWLGSEHHREMKAQASTGQCDQDAGGKIVKFTAPCH